jgi:hypothetical protein
MTLKFPGRALRANPVACIALSIGCALALQGCGGGGSSSAASEQAPPPASPVPPTATNHPPAITGTPPATVTAGTPYSFTPAASDPDGDALTFSVSNKPAWASFNASTGALTGTPTNSGSFPNVTISVSDGTASASLAAYTLTVSAAASSTSSVTLSWTPPTEHTDGSVLADLAGYKIHYGTSSTNFDKTITVSNPGLSSYVIDSLSAGTYYFVVTAYDSKGVESPSSNSASKTLT